MFTQLLKSPTAVDTIYPYNVNYSCRFDSTTPSYLTQTMGSATNSYKWTYSTWLKRGLVNAARHSILAAGVDANNRAVLQLYTDYTLYLFAYQGAATTCTVYSEALFKDPGSWCHLVCTVDTTQATANDRVKLYSNGVELECTHTTNPGQNTDIEINTAIEHEIGQRTVTDTYFFDGYLAQTIFVDGQALDPSSFGVAVGSTWVPINYSGTYGNNGFRLNYSNASDLGDDTSGNTNDFVETGFSTADQTIDTPTNNYCTLNPIHHDTSATISNGNLECSGTENEYGTFAISSGKWAWEITVNENGSFGIEAEDGTEEVLADVSGEVVEMEFDATNGTLKKRVDGGGLETIEASVDMNKVWFPHFKAACAVDFGQLGFTPTDSNYKTVCSESLITQVPLVSATVLSGSAAFDAVTYTGTGAELEISDYAFSPDLIWIKNRDAADEHESVDSIRGATYKLNPNSTAAQAVIAQGVKSIDSDGFTLGTDNRYNTNTEDYVAWSWLETPVAGFDMVQYEGTGVAHTESHNLGVVPELMIVKNIDSIDAWYVYHKDMNASPEDGFLKLDTADAYAASALWDNTAPTSSVFSVGTPNKTNANGDTFMAYLWASIPGFSRIGSYTGNGNTDGPFVHLDFRPRFVMLKCATTAATSWAVVDTARTDINTGSSDWLYPDIPDVEGTGIDTDLLSNGFKHRNTSGYRNTNAATYVYAAFAETPFAWANAK